MSKKRKTPSKRSVQVRVPEAQNPRLAKLAKVAKVVVNSFDVKTFQWIAAVVFGLALEAERAQAAQSQAELELNPDTQSGDEQNLAEQNSIEGGDVEGADEHLARSIHLGPRSEMLLAQVVTAPLNDSLDTLSQLKQFFTNWFSKHPTPKLTDADLAAGVDVQIALG